MNDADGIGQQINSLTNQLCTIEDNLQEEISDLSVVIGSLSDELKEVIEKIEALQVCNQHIEEKFGEIENELLELTRDSSLQHGRLEIQISGAESAIAKLHGNFLALHQRCIDDMALVQIIGGLVAILLLIHVVHQW